MKYEKGEKITFVEAIQKMEKGEVVYSTSRFYRKNNGCLEHQNSSTLAWESNVCNYSLIFMMKSDWYTAKQVEEKFIPTEDELFGWWYKDEDIKIQNSMGISTYTIVKNIKEGWRPVTPEIKNKFLEQVKKELNK